MPKLFFTLLVIAFFHFGQGQPHRTSTTTDKIKAEIDSLIVVSNSSSLSHENRIKTLSQAHGLLKKLEEDSLKLQLLSKLSYYSFDTHDKKLFKEINKETIQLAAKTKDSTVLAEAHWDRGVYYRENLVKDSAYYNFSEAQKIYEAKGNYYYSGRMFFNMAVEQSDIRDYVGSEASTIAAIERLKPLNKHKELYRCYNNLAIISAAIGEYERALKYYDEAVTYLQKTDNPDIYMTSYLNNRAIAYLDMGNYSEARKYFKQTIETNDLKNNNPGLYSKALHNLALSRLKLNDTVGTYQSIQESIRLKDSLNETRSLAASYYTLAEYYLYRKDTAKAILKAKTAMELSDESSNNERLLDTYKFLASVDRKNASKYFQKYISLDDSLQKEERQARNKFARIRFETDEFIAENELLEEQKSILARQKQMWTGIAIGFFLLGLAVYIIIQQRAKNQKLLFLQQQHANNQEIFNLMLTQKQKVDEVKRMEQKRISEELHDGVLGKMLGARMVLTGLNKKTGPEAIEARGEAIKALKTIEGEVRAISHELSHSAYQKINNFVNSIDSLLNSAKENTEINTIFNYDEDEDFDSLKGEIKINVYRMIQETLQNAIKHSGCSNFFVNFERSEELFSVEMGDDGKGFILDKERKGIGMRNLSSRIEKLNGKWFIDTAPNKGTKVTLEIPLFYAESNTKNQLQDV